MQRVKVGDAIDAQDHGLAVNDELPDTVLQCALNNPRIAAGPVVTASCNQAHAITVTLQAEAPANRRYPRAW